MALATRRILLPSLLALSATVALGAGASAAHAQRAERVRPNNVKLTAKDNARLDRTAARFEREIRAKYTPVVDLHITEGTLARGVQFKKVQNPRLGTKGPTVFEVTGVDKAGGTVDMVMSGGASGHVMQSHYGGRPLSVVEEYGRTDQVHLTYKGPGDATSREIINTQSRGLVTQEGFSMKLGKGEHTFFYFRGKPGGEASGGEGSEPELRQVKLIVK